MLVVGYVFVKSELTDSIPGVPHMFMENYSSLLEQPNGPLSRLYVQTCLQVK